MQYEVEIGGRLRRVVVHRRREPFDGTFTVAIDGRERTVDAVRIDAQLWSLLVGATSYEVTITPTGAQGETVVGVGVVPISVSLNGRRRSGRKEEGGPSGSGPERLVAPMPGKIVRVLVKRGETVRARQTVVVVEAMKMENELRAGRDGTVAEIHAVEGQSVDAGVLLAVIAASAE